MQKPTKYPWFSRRPQNGSSSKKVNVVVQETSPGEFYQLWIYVERRKFKGHQFTGINAEKMAKQAARKVWKNLAVT